MKTSQSKNDGPVADFVRQVEVRAAQYIKKAKSNLPDGPGEIIKFHAFGRAFADVNAERIDCNVAKFVYSPKENWDVLIKQPAQLIEVDLKILQDLQRLAKINNSLENSVLELMAFYSEYDSLNIIMQPDTLEGRTSYATYTLQFANTLKTTQSTYTHVKVLFNKTTSQLGIFCRKQKIKSSGSFASVLSEVLVKNQKVFIHNDDLPQTYHTNLGMLTYQLKQKLGDDITVTAVRHSDGINIFIYPKDSN